MRWVYNVVGVIAVGLLLHVITVVADVHLFEFLDSKSRAKDVEILNSHDCDWEVVERKINAAENYGDLYVSYDTWSRRWNDANDVTWRVKFERRENPRIEFVMEDNLTVCEAVDKMYRRVTSYGLSPLGDD